MLTFAAVLCLPAAVNVQTGEEVAVKLVFHSLSDSDAVFFLLSPP
jgi:hypothetical protein